MPISVEERFLAKVAKRESGCWEWTAYIRPNGYGHFGRGGVVVMAHRASYALFVGPIPPGLEIDHVCNNRRCVNPAHLRAVTHRENTLAAHSDCTAAVLARSTHCKQGHALTPENVYRYGRIRKCRPCALDRAHRQRQPQGGI